MANEKFTQLPTVSTAQLSDIICAVQAGVSSQETLQQILNLISTNLISQGTFTPVFTPTIGSFGSITYLNQNGFYIKISNLVFFTLNLQLSAISIGTASGLLNITGLPIPSAVISDCAFPISYSAILGTSTYTSFIGEIDFSTDVLQLMLQNPNNTNAINAPPSILQAGSSIFMSGCYIS
jgi:hypothetical protein